MIIIPNSSNGLKWVSQEQIECKIKLVDINYEIIKLLIIKFFKV